MSILHELMHGSPARKQCELCNVHFTQFLTLGFTVYPITKYYVWFGAVFLPFLTSLHYCCCCCCHRLWWYLNVYIEISKCKIFDVRSNYTRTYVRLSTIWCDTREMCTKKWGEVVAAAAVVVVVLYTLSWWHFWGFLWEKISLIINAIRYGAMH